MTHYTESFSFGILSVAICGAALKDGYSLTSFSFIVDCPACVEIFKSMDRGWEKMVPVEWQLKNIEISGDLPSGTFTVDPKNKVSPEFLRAMEMKETAEEKLQREAQ
jgi:hypothetical protein